MKERNSWLFSSSLKINDEKTHKHKTAGNRLPETKGHSQADRHIDRKTDRCMKKKGIKTPPHIWKYFMVILLSTQKNAANNESKAKANLNKEKTPTTARKRSKNSKPSNLV